MSSAALPATDLTTAFMHKARDAGAVVSTFKPITVSAATLETRQRGFQERFLATLRGEGASLLASNVYHDIQRPAIEAFANAPDDYNSLDTILGGRNSWKAVVEGKPRHDQEIIDTALDQDLLDLFGGKNLYFISYGPGPNGTAKDKEGRIIARAKAQGIAVEGFTGIDLNRTFAGECSHLIGDAFDIPATGMLGDFVWGEVGGLPEITVNEGTVKIVSVFGNTAFNAPSFTKDGKPVSYQDSVENFFARMNVQNGLGHYLLLTVDTDQNPRTQEKKYAVTNEHEQLILTPMALARIRGIIDKPYSILSHWRMAVEYDQRENTVLMKAVAKNNHAMPVLGEEIAFASGDSRVIMASHKWREHTTSNLLGMAGYAIKAVIEGSYNPHKLIVAQAIREPRRAPF